MVRKEMLGAKYLNIIEVRHILFVVASAMRRSPISSLLKFGMLCFYFCWPQVLFNLFIEQTIV